jgi:hypothetical protein
MLSALLIVSISFCYAQKISDITVPNEMSVICVARGSDIRSSWADFPILLNGYEIFSLGRNQYGYIFLKPGTYTIVSGMEYKKGSYFAPETFLKTISLDEGDFLLFELKMKLGAANLSTLLNYADEKDYTELNKKCKLSSSNTQIYFKDSIFHQGNIVSDIDYQAFLKGNLERVQSQVDNLSTINKTINPGADPGSDGIRTETFNNDPNTSMGTTRIKKADGSNRYTTKTKCYNCQGSGIATIGGNHMRCPSCQGKGYR